MKQVIDSKNLGDILWMRGRYGKEVDNNYTDTWRCNRDLNGGGILIDQGIHMVDLMSYLSGGFDGAQAVLSSSYLNVAGVEDNGFITLYSTSKKISASIHTTVTQWRYLFSLEVFLEKGSIVLNGLRTKSGNYGDEILTIKPNLTNENKISFTEEKFVENISWQKEIDAKGINVHVGDQADVNLWSRLLNKNLNNIDVFIDDGGYLTLISHSAYLPSSAWLI